MKKNTLLLFSLFSLWGVSVNAQNAQIKKKITATYGTTSVEEIKTLEEQHLSVREFAYQTAKKLGKPTKGITADGRVFSLQRVDEKGRFFYYVTSNAGSRTTARVNDIAPGGSLGLNLDGTGMTVAVWDGEPALDTHVEFQGGQNGGSRMLLRNPVQNLQSMSEMERMIFEEGRSHATHVSGTIGAKGVNANAKGMAPEARILSYDWENDTAEMTRAAAQDVLLVSNHSYGIGVVDENGRPVPGITDILGAYIWSSEDFDKITYRYKYYQPVVAAGNDREYYRLINPTKNGSDLLAGTAVSKNVVVVAAVNQVNTYTGPESVRISTFSNYGPTNDFRIKPDISAKGVRVFSSNYELPRPISATPSNNKYVSFDGTSMAAPAVTGIFTLWQQWAMENREMPLKSATIRALMVHTADEAGNAPGPDHIFGWGLINAKAGVQLLQGSKVSGVVLEENELAQGETYEKQFSVSESGIKIIVTLAWTDPEGIFSENNMNENYAKNNPSLINDLDVRVYKDGVEFLPWKLNKDFNDLKALKGDNDVDNVEKIEIDAAETGTYVVKVTHKGTLKSGKQEYSLIMSRSDFNNLSTEEFELDESLFALWPNPVMETLNVMLPEEADLNGMSIELFDLSGRRIEQINTVTTNLVEIDVRGLSSGVYIVKIKGNGFEKTERIVKK
ncbi:S8 family peptidase [Myroides sp. DF42-4-2]|uniref:S8 family peptidase n=1 Tax=unclassified Myroides TaxID=2642485 RepID=UPI0025764646|nr:S8 family peptidase [Myroides sp. DF42-4-2]MDM1409069.1 S8 family peptidase [Myroides sp. DF42-4-2]